MKFFSRKKETKKNEDNFLLYIPKKKHKEWETKKGKVFLIFHHDKKVERFLRWLVSKATVSDVELDNIGSKVWSSIDGKNTIYDIGVILEETFGDKCNPTYDRLILYMRYLIKKGWISFEKSEQMMED